MSSRRCLSLLVALFVAFSVVFSNGGIVSAAQDPESPGGWIEILEFSSVQTNNENWFQVSGGSGSFTLQLHTEKRLSRVDMLVWHQTADYPISASVGNKSLQVIRIENNLSRICGLIPNAYYEKLTVTFGVSTRTSATWELLSCRVTPFSQTDYNAQAELYQAGDLPHYTIPTVQEFYGDGSGNTVPSQFCVVVKDWQKYDSITIIGSVQGFGLNSIRASVGSVGLPYTLTYTSTNSNGSDTSYYLWSDVKEYVTDDTEYQGSITGSAFEMTLYDGKVLFNLTIDLTGIDRSLPYQFTVWFTGLFPDNAYIVQMVGVTGSVITADTTDVTWWGRFTSFMEGLFASDDNNDILQDAVGSSQDVVEDKLGAVAQAGAVIDDLTGVFQYQGVMDTIAFPSLTINFGGVPWTFGGWDVSVIPPGFEPLVESLKLLIDIVATLAFVQAMRHRLEKLLVGGNA